MKSWPTNKDYFGHFPCDMKEVKLASPKQWPESPDKKYAASGLKFQELFEWNNLAEADLKRFQEFASLPRAGLSDDIYDVLHFTDWEIKKNRSYLERMNGNRPFQHVHACIDNLVDTAIYKMQYAFAMCASLVPRPSL